MYRKSNKKKAKNPPIPAANYLDKFLHVIP
jgi:hypothetical protein